MIETIVAFVKNIAGMIIAVLPLSPFQQYLDQFSNLPYMGFLNWFIPVGDIVKIGMAWLGAIALFYVYSIVMRWVKMIGD